MAGTAAPSRLRRLPVASGAPAAVKERSWAPMVAACVGLAALSLLAPGTPTYDPMSWIVWGREIAHGSLDTMTGPSWKPLPMLFTVPFSLLGDQLAPALWLVVARAGGLLGVAMGFRLAARLAGPVAGVFAAAAILTSEGYAYHAYRGNSEGLLVGLTLWAVERHLDGRRTAAFGLGLGAALLRPEVWPMWGLYGLWLAWLEPARRKLVLAGCAVIPIAWFVPEYLGSGDLLRAAARARAPNLDSAAYAAFPAWEVLRQSAMLVPLVVGAGALAAVAVALKRRTGDHDRVVLLLAGSAAALLAAVAVMTQAGFSGNLRYVLLPLAFIVVLGGAGWVEAVRALRGRAGLAAAVAAAALGVAGVALAALDDAPALRDQVVAAGREAALIDDLHTLVRRAGGPARFTACRAVYATRFQVPSVAWELHLHLEQVEIFALPPGTTLAPRDSRLAHDPRFRRFAASPEWVAAQSCP